MAHDDGTMGIAEDDLRTHVDELVDKEQTALEHLLVEEHRASGLGGYGDKYGQEVGCESRPRSIGQRHDGAVDERLYLIMAHGGNKQVVTLFLHLDAHAAESVGDDAQVLHRHILNPHAFAHHRGHTDERPHLNHVGQYAVLRSVETFHTLNSEEVGADTADAGSHGVEHTA